MAQIPQAEPGRLCPFHRVDMAKVCHKCPLWIQVRGRNPQGGDVDGWDCSFAWLPMLLIENAKQQRSTAAATESFRNEMVKSRAEGVAAFVHALGQPRFDGPLSGERTAIGYDQPE